MIARSSEEEKQKVGRCNVDDDGTGNWERND